MNVYTIKITALAIRSRVLRYLITVHCQRAKASLVELRRGTGLGLGISMKETV